MIRKRLTIRQMRVGRRVLSEGGIFVAFIAFIAFIAFVAFMALTEILDDLILRA